MKKGKKVLSLIISLILLVMVVGCSQTQKPVDSEKPEESQSEKGEPEFTIRYSHCNSQGNLVYEAAEFFKKTIEEASNGRIAVQIYPAGQLATGDDENMKNLTNGTIEMAPAAPLAMAKAANMPQYNILDLPYVFSGVQEARDFCNGEVFEKLDNEFREKTGLIPLVWYQTGTNAVGNTKRPITDPADMSGIKLRTANSDAILNTVKIMGGNPVPIAFGETYTAVQQGVVDGLITPFVNFYAEKFFEITPYVSQWNSSVFFHCLFVNEDFYNSLPDDLKVIFDESAEKFDAFAAEEGDKFEFETVPQLLRENGVELVQFTDEQIAKFQEATKPVVEENIDIIGRDFYEAAMKELGR